MDLSPQLEQVAASRPILLPPRRTSPFVWCVAIALAILSAIATLILVSREVYLPPRRTHPVIWCVAIFCAIAAVLVILTCIATLVMILVVIKPKTPIFDITYARLNTVNLDSQSFFIGDLTLFANFSNRNSKLNLLLEDVVVELYLHNLPLASQALQASSQRPGEGTVKVVHMISSEIHLPSDVAGILQDEVRSRTASG